jgi:hypothetical protein
MAMAMTAADNLIALSALLNPGPGNDCRPTWLNPEVLDAPRKGVTAVR